jgi:predicted DNA-binding protein
MSRKKVSTTIYITPEQADRLKLLHDRTKVPIAVYIREGIDMVLKHYEHMLPGQMTFEAVPSAQAGSAQTAPSQGAAQSVGGQFPLAETTAGSKK